MDEAQVRAMCFPHEVVLVLLLLEKEFLEKISQLFNLFSHATLKGRFELKTPLQTSTESLRHKG